MIAIVLLRFDSVEEAEKFIRQQLDDDQPAVVVAMDDMDPVVMQ